jgi:outer membrane receptor protein involved in Fe transport
MRYTPLALAGTALAIALGGASVAGAAGGDAQITVGTPATLHAGQAAPLDAPGVKAVRRGKPIPRGYALVGRDVTIDRGTAGTTGAAFSLTCPSGKTARTLGFTGQDGPQLIGDRYVGHRSVRVAVWGPPNHAQSHGTSYVVCR